MKFWIIFLCTLLISCGSKGNISEEDVPENLQEKEDTTNWRNPTVHDLVASIPYIETPYLVSCADPPKPAELDEFSNQIYEYLNPGDSIVSKIWQASSWSFLLVTNEMQQRIIQMMIPSGVVRTEYSFASLGCQNHLGQSYVFFEDAGLFYEFYSAEDLKADGLDIKANDSLGIITSIERYALSSSGDFYLDPMR